jgi:hypothetical protein
VILLYCDTAQSPTGDGDTAKTAGPQLPDRINAPCGADH